jgi:putative hydrolase of the HAD superfamily
MTRQHLIIDADDTLWENNIFFEQAFEEFADYLSHSSLSREQVRDVLDAIEAVNAKVHGYGSKRFGRNLVETYHELAERPVSDSDLATIVGFAEKILDHPIIFLPEVEETLVHLAERHELTLFTKGHPEEQQAKVDRSGVSRFFSHVGIVREKEIGVYRRLSEERGFHLPHTWMIGNSPRSDVNPALRAGMNAVYIPHPRTWILEREEVVPAETSRLLELRHFGELREWF